MYKLAEKRKAKSSGAGEQALAYIKKGLHPWLAQGEKAAQRKTIGRGMWESAGDGRVKRAKRGKKEEEDQEEADEERRERVPEGKGRRGGEERRGGRRGQRRTQREQWARHR